MGVRADDRLDQAVADFTGVDENDALQQILASADETVRVAATFGASRLGKLIPSTDPEQIRLQQQAQRQAALLQPDLLLMQQSLQDLGLMVNGSGDASLILDTLLQGLHRGVGLEQ